MSKLLPRKALTNDTKLLGLAIAQIVACLSFAGTVQVGTPVVAGSDITVPVVLQGDVGAGVSAMDFRLRYDPAVLQPVGFVAGTAAADARKTVQANVVAPGECVVVLFGMNQSVIQSGEVVTVAMKKVGEAASGQSQISINQTTMASFQGQEIASEGSVGTVDFSATPPQEGEDTPDPPAPPDNSGGDPNPTPTDPDTPANPGNGGVPRFVNGADPDQDDASDPGKEADPSEQKPTGVVPVPGGTLDDSRAKLAEATDELNRRRAAIPVAALDAASRQPSASASGKDGSDATPETGSRQAAAPVPRGARGSSPQAAAAGTDGALKTAQAGVPGAGSGAPALLDTTPSGNGAPGGGASRLPVTWAVLAGVLVGALMLGAVYMLLRKRLFL